MEIIGYEEAYKARTIELDLEALAVLGDEALIRRHASEDWQDAIKALGGEIFLLKEGDAILGMCAYVPRESGTAELKKFRIAGQRQGGGLGSKLLGFVESRLRDKGIERITLETSELRGKTLRFYDQRGYIRVGRRTVDGVGLVDYEKSISPAGYVA